MPRPTGLTYMSRAEGQKKLSKLPKIACSCGHTDVQAAAYYSKPNSPRNATGQWAMCVPCFRNREKLRQQGKLPPLTIEDIRNPKRKSGFDHINRQTPNGRTRVYYNAQVYGGKLSKAGHSWRGPNRATAEEAAQDYCDYINSQRTASPATPALKSAGHQGQRDRIDRDEEVEAALGVLRDRRGARQGRQGYVYLIGEVEGDKPLFKIGYSTNPEARLREIQTCNGRILALFAKIPGTMADEAALHAKFIHLNTVQEWFKYDPSIFEAFGIEDCQEAA